MKKNHGKRAKAKLSKIESSCYTIAASHDNPIPYEDKFVVVDGGVGVDPPPGIRKEIMTLTEKDFDNTVYDHIKDPSKGVYCYSEAVKGQQVLEFMVVPRESALKAGNFTKAENVASLLDAMNDIAKASPVHNVRQSSSTRLIFTDKKNYGTAHVYSTVGTTIPLGSKGQNVSSQLEQLEQKGCTKAWNKIHQAVRQAEFAFEQWMPSNIIAATKEAKRLNGYKTYVNSKGLKSTEHFGAMAYGKNVHLNAHTDEDFAYSVTLIHKKDCEYSLNDDPVIYFAFTSIKQLVPLRPGDMLIFNPQHAHCVSSRFNSEDEIYCASLYLKTKAVGRNDNSLPLTVEQEIVL